MRGKKILTLLMSALLVMPVYPGSKKVWENKMTVGDAKTTTLRYQTSAAPEKVIKFFLNKLTRTGWFLEEKSLDPPYLSFSDTSLSKFTVTCQPTPKPGINDIIINHTEPLSQEMINAMALDTEYPGKDVPGVPRYPGSTRKYYTYSEQVTTVVYESLQGCLDCVLRFYRAEMVARGWELTKEVSSDLNDVLKVREYPEEFLQTLSAEQRTQLSKIKNDLPGMTQEFQNVPFVTLSFYNSSGNAMINVLNKDNKAYVMVLYINYKK